MPLPIKPPGGGGGGEFGGIKNYETPPPAKPITETPYSDPNLDRLLNHPLPSKRISMEEYYAGLLAGQQARDAWNQSQIDRNRASWERMMQGARDNKPFKMGHSLNETPEFKPSVDPYGDDDPLAGFTYESWRTTYPDGKPIPKNLLHPWQRNRKFDLGLSTPGGARGDYWRDGQERGNAMARAQVQQAKNYEKARRQRAMRESLGY